MNNNIDKIMELLSEIIKEIGYCTSDTLKDSYLRFSLLEETFAETLAEIEKISIEMTNLSERW